LKTKIKPIKNIHLLVINGSISGSKGNTAAILKNILLPKALKWQTEFDAQLQIKTIHLNSSSQHFSQAQIKKNAQWATHFIFATGTYWDSWGSPLQQFFEASTFLEAHRDILGKPAMVLVTMHAVGGKEVLSRMQGVLSSQGYALPPMSGICYSLQDYCMEYGPDFPPAMQSFSEDFWSVEDLTHGLYNLLCYEKSPCRPWPIDRKNPKRKWFFKHKFSE